MTMAMLQRRANVSTLNNVQSLPYRNIFNLTYKLFVIYILFIVGEATTRSKQSIIHKKFALQNYS